MGAEETGTRGFLTLQLNGLAHSWNFCCDFEKKASRLTDCHDE
jgi:hypothetical protein